MPQIKRSDQIRSVAQSCPTLCNPMNRSTPGLPEKSSPNPKLGVYAILPSTRKYLLIGRTVRDKSFFLSYFFLLAGFPRWLSVKNLSATQETQVRSLGQEDPLEKEMAIHSSILAWEIP